MSTRAEVPGFGEVHIRRLKTAAMLELSKLESEESGLAIVAAAVVDEDGARVFESAKEVAEVDWPLVQALLAACTTANSLDVAAAKKN